MATASDINPLVSWGFNRKRQMMRNAFNTNSGTAAPLINKIMYGALGPFIKMWTGSIWDRIALWSQDNEFSGTNKFGSSTNYVQIDPSGKVSLAGTATIWDDLQGPATQIEVSGVGITHNTTENTLTFLTSANLSDYAYINFQMSHSWKIGSQVHPHLHVEQAQNNIPNFLIRYRWQIQGGAKTTSWTDYIPSSSAFTYTSGTLNQIFFNSGITPPVGAGLSDILEIRIYRDNANSSGLFAGADPYTTGIDLVFTDIHIEKDTLGSNDEYTK